MPGLDFSKTAIWIGPTSTCHTLIDTVRNIRILFERILRQHPDICGIVLQDQNELLSKLKMDNEQQTHLRFSTTCDMNYYLVYDLKYIRAYTFQPLTLLFRGSDFLVVHANSLPEVDSIHNATRST